MRNRNSAGALSMVALAEWHPLFNHPIRKEVYEWMRDGGMDPQSVEKEAEGSLSWNVTIGEGMSFFVHLYLDESGRAYFMMEAAIARVPERMRASAAIYLLGQSRDSYEAYRFALLDEQTATCLVRGQADGYTPAYVAKLLREFTLISQRLQDDLCGHFEAIPFLSRKVSVPE